MEDLDQLFGPHPDCVQATADSIDAADRADAAGGFGALGMLEATVLAVIAGKRESIMASADPGQALLDFWREARPRVVAALQGH